MTGAGGPPDWPADAVEVGRVIGAFGVRGELKVKPFSADPQALFSSKRWYLAAAERPAAPVPPPLLRVVRARDHGEVVIAQVHELADRDAAQALAGCRVYVARSSFPTPDDGEFYWVDLIGMTVVNRDGEPLGRVTGLLETGPHCVLCLDGRDAEGHERLIPFVDRYVDGVDAVQRQISVDWSADF